MELAGSFAGNRLKKFFSRAELDHDHAEHQAVICVLDGLEDEESGQGHAVEEVEEEEDLYGSLDTGLELDVDGGLIL